MGSTCYWEYSGAVEPGECLHYSLKRRLRFVAGEIIYLFIFELFSELLICFLRENKR